MKRLCGILLALAGLFLYAPCAAQNTRVRGTVTDAQTGEPIPYAVVLFPGTTTGITTDDEGFYSLESRDTSSYIRAEMVSYEPQIRPVHVGGYNQIDFRLTPSHLEIESVVITPGDNPAHPILEGIIRNKKYNDSKEYDRYICRTYTKMELGLANIREFRSKKLQQNFGFIFEHLDTSSVTGQPYLPVMISETAADYYHSRTPSVAREVIRASQISGIEDNSVLAQFTGHLHADVNLYENFIDLFGVKFASPLSNSGRSFYKYFLVDSTNVEGRKTYKIRFHPKSVATPVLDGEVNIDSASYALRSARVKMAKGVNVNWIRHLAIEADNRLTADSLWFPQREKMTADFTLTKSDSSKMIAFLGSHEVTYSDVKFDTPIPKQVLGTSASVILSDDAISGKQVEWDSLRPYTLTQKEKAIYQMVDSIQQVPLYKNIYTVLNTIIGGYYNTKYVGIGPYSKVISFNRLEGARFQIGARTTKEFSRRVRLSTYLAYGTRDEDFKGAAEVELMLRRQLLRKLTVTYRNDAIQLSSGVSALSENNILSSIFSRGGTSRLSTIEEGIALYEHEWLHGISSSFELRGRHISSNRYVPMILPDGRSLHGINDASIRIGLRLSKDETIVRMPFEVRHMGSKYPIFSFDFTGAKRGVLPASYDYLRLEGRMQYRLNLPPVGYSRLMLDDDKNKIPVAGQDGKTPTVNEDGYWEIDGETIKGEDGQPIKAVGKDGANGDKGEDGDSFFKSVVQDADNVTFTLTNGDQIVLPKAKEVNFVIERTSLTLKFGASQDLAVTQKGVETLAITKPDGWRAWLEGDVLTITAPAKENVYAETSGEVSVVAVGATATVIAKVQVLATDEILGGASAGSSDWEEWN